MKFLLKERNCREIKIIKILGVKEDKLSDWGIIH